MAPPVLEKDGSFYCTLISIQVESCLFKVPRELFALYSEVFKNMFSLPRVGGPGDMRDGDRDDQPLFLDGIKKDDFRAFLTALCALHHETVNSQKIAGKTNLVLIRYPESSALIMSGNQWIAALRLSHMWGFDNVRAKAIAGIEALGDGTITSPGVSIIQRLKLAHELHITAWIRPAYQYFMTRTEELTVAEVPWLGADFVQKVAKAREERTTLFLLRILSRDISIPSCPSCRKGKLKLVDFTTSSQSQATPNHQGASASVQWTLLCAEVHSLPLFFVSTVTQPAPTRMRSSWTLEELYGIEYAANSLMKLDVDRLIDKFLPIS